MVSDLGNPHSYLKQRSAGLTRLFLLLAAVFTLPAHALEGTLNCVIQNQNLLEINDGVGSQYKGYKNDLVAGDRVFFIMG